MKLIMLKGLPGSGKSTWAKEYVSKNPGWVRINKDSLREMMGSYRTGKDESLILAWRDILIMSSLRKGKNVIVDDTNFHPQHEEKIKGMIYSEQATVDPLFVCDIEVKFFDVPLEQCIKNDLKRPNSVGEKVIRKMWRDYLYQKYPAPPYNFNLPNAIICDLDGTLCIHNGRSPYDVDKCDTDLLNPAVYEIIMKTTGAIIFVSGREDKYREKTQEWLHNNLGLAYTALYMRPTGDMRKDDIVKEEIYLTQIMNKYNVSFVLDDRNRVVDMWRRNGLTCLQVADGNF